MHTGAGCPTAPVCGSGRVLSTPVGSQSSSRKASSSEARSGIVRSKLLAIPQTFTRQAPLPSVGRLSGKPATILEHPSGKPAIVRCGSFPPGEPGFPTFRSSPGKPFDFLPVSHRASSPGGLSQFPCPKAQVSPDSGKVGSALGLPAASRFFPAAPPERPWLPSRRISALSALAASGVSSPLPVGHS